MSTVLAIFGVLLLGYCSGQGTSAGDKKECGFNAVCVMESECINGTVNVYGEGGLAKRSNYEACEDYQLCCRLDSEEEPNSMAKMVAEPLIENKPNCGTYKIGFSNKRNEADFGEFPWLLLLKNIKAGNFYGSASLIHPQIAMTAAHVVQNIEHTEIMVYAGVWLMDNPSNPQQEQTRTVSEKILHNRFNSRSLINDIALLFLSSPFQLNEHINTVCLPPPNYAIDLVKCYGTGWGLIIGGTEFAKKPKKIDLPTLSNVSCQRYLRDTVLTGIFKLHKSFMCAGGQEDKDVCFGDGGSPLVCAISGKTHKKFQVGIVSWGLECGIKDVPGVYASLPYHRVWVDVKVIERGHDPTFYTY